MTTPVLATKTCSKCGEVKPLSEFHRLRKSTDGRYSSCKVCVNQETNARLLRVKTEDPEGYRIRNRENVARHRERTGNARGIALNRARQAAISGLIEAHRQEYDERLRLAKYEAGLL